MRISVFASLLFVVTYTTAAEQAPDVAFLTIDEARTAIIDESIEPYFSLLQTQEMSAKTGSVIDGDTLEDQREACRKRYQANVREFTAVEQAALRQVIAGVQPFLVQHYPVFAAEPWRFIKIARTFEGGMPHTRGHCIVLSDTVMPMLVNPMNPEGTMLLVHEQTHVVQRLHPQLFAPLYGEAWGMVLMPKAPRPTDDLIKHQLVNPDGVACTWVFPVTREGKTELFQPQVIFGVDAAVPRMPRDFNVVALPVEKHGEVYDYVRTADGHARSIQLNAVSAYVDAFDPSEENFHPNEISAELFSRQVTLDLYGHPEEETPCQKSLRGWAESYLGAVAAKSPRTPLPRMQAVVSQPVGGLRPGEGEIVCTLGKGETLTSVAKRFGVSMTWLIKRNDLRDMNAVKEGLHLIVPRPATP